MAAMVKNSFISGKRMFIELFFVTEEGKGCLMCNGALTADSSAILAAHYFCSAHCYRKYLIRERDDKKGCRNKCLKFGCSKPRYISGHEVFDYCSRSHADEHKEWLVGLWSRKRAEHHCSGCNSIQESHGRQVSQKSPLQFHHQDGSSAPILFYNRDEPYFEFTNFARFPIVIDGLQYPTSEHYYQSQKLIGTPFVAHICSLPSARQAFEFPRRPHVSQWIRKDWDSVKEDVMYRALVTKFQQHRELQFKLFNTGRRKLVEHSPYDSYWGDGPDGKGLNKLGILLMRLRDTRAFVKAPGESSEVGGSCTLLADSDNHTPVSYDHNSQHSSDLGFKSSPPHGKHVEADGESLCQAECDSSHALSNNGSRQDLSDDKECSIQENLSSLPRTSADEATHAVPPKVAVIDSTADCNPSSLEVYHDNNPPEFQEASDAKVSDSTADDNPTPMEISHDNPPNSQDGDTKGDTKVLMAGNSEPRKDPIADDSSTPMEVDHGNPPDFQSVGDTKVLVAGDNGPQREEAVLQEDDAMEADHDS